MKPSQLKEGQFIELTFPHTKKLAVTFIHEYTILRAYVYIPGGKAEDAISFDINPDQLDTIYEELIKDGATKV